MALKEEPYALPLKVGGRTFCRATVCAAGTCILASYFESPSVAWMATSPLVVDGEIVVLPKFNGWVQKSHLRVEWPYAISIWKRPGSTKSLAFFVYHLAEAAYYVFKVPVDAQVALMMGYQCGAVVCKENILLYNLAHPTKAPISLSASTPSQIMPSLCSSTTERLILASGSTVQEWHILPKNASTSLHTRSAPPN